MSKVLFIDTVHPILAERLENAGYQCDWHTNLNREETLGILKEYEGVVIRSKFKFDQEAIEKAIQLKWIARSGAGMENIDTNFAESKDIKCFNSPEGNRDAVAEHAIGMILSLFNNLNRADREVKSGSWQREENRGIELKGKTVGILGFGFMGEAFAQRLTSFGCRIIAYDKYKSGFGNGMIEEVDLKTFFTETDILSIHLPLTEETNHLINKDFLEKFHKNIFVINTARGNNINTSELMDRIKSGKVLGACLDVLELESMSFENLSTESFPAYFEFLKQSENVILSPHVAGWTMESYFKLSDVLADKILSRFP